MDLNTHFLIDYPEQYIASRLASAGTYRFGTGSAAVVMIAALAAGVRRVSARIETWAQGTTTNDAAERGLPRAHSVR
ncbi:MAG: hypothetical protein IT295_05230 [Dehalococcoidia bacterium]|jgi:hypothetical protein|nr:hypothetical protein [Dehalococcoidia bacterium]